MGVWTTGPLARAEALTHPQLRAAYEKVLPGWTDSDVAGSPYAIADYQVPPALGGEAGLEAFSAKTAPARIEAAAGFRAEPSGFGSSVVKDRPDLFVQSSTEAPGTFRSRPQRQLLAGPRQGPLLPTLDRHGPTGLSPRGHTDSDDPIAPVNRQPLRWCPLRHGHAGTQRGLCPDLGAFPGCRSTVPAANHQVFLPEFWSKAISAVKKAHPGFLFLAEAYWGLETRLQTLGFDFTYDKTLYDGLVAGHPSEVRSPAGDDCRSRRRQRALSRKPR